MGATCCSDQNSSSKGEIEAQSASVLDTTPKLSIAFRANTSTDSEKKVVYFKKAPLGMSFTSNTMPIIVKDVTDGGEAKSIGVEPNMVIEKIGDEDITDSTYNDAFQLLRQKVDELPK
mmetsp:Transcript_113283/g.225620  ORF Transcript_113283/g.225620 Transcript_113283/m.225620 type:complete len:118 (-) Transcript_113283:293-646(-)